MRYASSGSNNQQQQPEHAATIKNRPAEEATMRRQFVQCCYAGLTSLLLVPAAVFAQTQAVTNSPVNLRAGPARDYPVVSQLPGGAPVTVMGCVAGYTWCDVALPNLRGWVYAGRISYPYQGSPVP
jgi:uncharacterized protein YraI